MSKRREQHETSASQEVISPIWLDANEYRLVEAVLLMLGHEPQGLSDALAAGLLISTEVPSNYDAALAAVSGALKHENIKGTLVYKKYDPSLVDIGKSTVEKNSLVKWLQSKNYTDCIWFTKGGNTKGFRDPNHPRYSAKLAAAVEAWESFDEKSDEPGRPKQRLTNWLRLNAERFGFIDDKGQPRDSVLEDLAKVANWDMLGGAPKQSGSESGPDK